MKELNIMQATQYTSPNPLTLICTRNEDGSTNVAPICFVSYLSFQPPMIGFAAGKQSHTAARTQTEKKAVITVPGKSLAEKVFACGESSGKDTAKVSEFGIEMKEIPDGGIQIPADTRLAFVCTLEKAEETGDHFFHICSIEKIYGDDTVDGLYAWNGFGKVAPAEEGNL